MLVPLETQIEKLRAALSKLNPTGEKVSRVSSLPHLVQLSTGV